MVIGLERSIGILTAAPEKRSGERQLTEAGPC